VVARKSPTQLLYEELKRRASRSLTHIFEDWKKFGRVRPVAAVWASEVVLDDNGSPIDDVVVCLLPEEEDQRLGVLHKMATRTKACAILSISQRSADVLAVFETPLGTVSWTYPIEDHGDVRVVGSARKEKKNAHHLGVLWAPSTGRA